MDKSYGIKNRDGKKKKIKCSSKKKYRDIWNIQCNNRSIRCAIRSEIKCYKNIICEDTYVIPQREKRYKTWWDCGKNKGKVYSSMRF